MDNEKKWYEFHWQDKPTSYIKGESEFDAAQNLGLTVGELKAIEFVKEAEEIPTDLKDVCLLNENSISLIPKGTLLCNAIISKVKENKRALDITIGAMTIRCTLEVTPFDIYVTESERKESDING